ncbi:MAG: DUF58 domain-containing protein [Anaerolineae bacterium]|nr:DUF58 domain-containing protein [Anaerolineales bacterium]MCQ3979650.1 DUF58 domain-containing protein [Anaerolineae bacterium]
MTSDSTFQPSSLPTFQPSNTLFPSSFLRRLETLTLIARQAQRGQWQGERRSPKRGQSVEFADYRNYVPGDDFRLVDWNAYARLERFFLKLFVEEQDLTVHLLVDTSRSMDWPPEAAGQPGHKFTYACRAAAALGYIALASLDRVTVSTVGGSPETPPFLPHRGRQQAFALFDYLGSLSATGSTNLAHALSRYAAHARHPGPLLIFSDLFDSSSQPSNPPTFQPSFASSLTPLLSRRFEISLIHLLSPDEVDPPLTGDLRLLDVETGHTVEITADYESLARYKAGLASWQTEIREWCGKRNIAYVPVTTDTPFEEFIFAFLRQRGILK